MIAFPKSGGGFDPLTAAPAPITAAAAQGSRRGRRSDAKICRTGQVPPEELGRSETHCYLARMR